MSAAAGFVIRASQVRSLERKIGSLEQEMLSNHAEILELQKERTLLEQQLKQSDIPVIPITSSKEEPAPEKDLSKVSRKKHL